MHLGQQRYPSGTKTRFNVIAAQIGKNVFQPALIEYCSVGLCNHYCTCVTPMVLQWISSIVRIDFTHQKSHILARHADAAPLVNKRAQTSHSYINFTQL